MKPSELQDKPTFQCRTEYILNDLEPYVFENHENFGETTKERTDYNFTMDMPYISEMQKKNKRLMTEIKKDNHKYELNKIARTLVLPWDGNIYIPTAVRYDVMGQNSVILKVNII
jgi:hypothetical protein